MTRISIIGAGVVGTATGKGFVRHGHDVWFVDVDRDRVDTLRAEGFAAATELRLAGGPQLIFLTLPTPNHGYRWDLEPFLEGTAAVGRAIGASNDFHTVVVRSTVPPQTCERVVTPLLERASGRRAGEGFSVASNPEFLRARSALEDFLHPWVTVVASRSPRTLERLSGLFEPFGGELYRFTDPLTAELIKCVHNLFNATKISFWNEIWSICSKVGADAHEIAEVVSQSAEASTNRDYGTRGGQPYGGACLPKDMKGFLGFADELGLETPLLTAVDGVNEQVPEPSQPSRDGHRDEPPLLHDLVRPQVP
jgi:UDPglucose 6-dehydrogenase